MAWPFAVYANMARPVVSTDAIYLAGSALIAMTCLANAMPLVLLGTALGYFAGIISVAVESDSEKRASGPFMVAIVGTLVGYACHAALKPPTRPPVSS